MSDLVEDGYVLRERRGQRNYYRVEPHLPLSDPLAQELEVGDLLRVLMEGKGSALVPGDGAEAVTQAKSPAG